MKHLLRPFLVLATLAVLLVFGGAARAATIMPQSPGCNVGGHGGGLPTTTPLALMPCPGACYPGGHGGGLPTVPVLALMPCPGGCHGGHGGGINPAWGKPIESDARAIRTMTAGDADAIAVKRAA